MALKLISIIIATWLISALYIQRCNGNEACNQVKNGTDEGFIRGPIGFFGSLLCSYLITVNTGPQVQVNLTDGSFMNQGGLLTSYLLVFNGSDCMNNRTLAYYDNSSQTVVSPSKNVSALLVKAAKTNTVSFTLHYKSYNNTNTAAPNNPPLTNRLLENCGSEVTGNSANISYRGSGKKNTLCIWRVTTTEGNNTHILFSHVALNNPNSWIRVIAGSSCQGQEILTFVGPKHLFYALTATSESSFLVLYSSAGDMPSEGFELYYSTSQPPTTPKRTTSIVLTTSGTSKWYSNSILLSFLITYRILNLPLC